jgi:hypothetical protein
MYAGCAWLRGSAPPPFSSMMARPPGINSAEQAIHSLQIPENREFAVRTREDAALADSIQSVTPSTAVAPGDAGLYRTALMVFTEPLTRGTRSFRPRRSLGRRRATLRGSAGASQSRQRLRSIKILDGA